MCCLCLLFFSCCVVVKFFFQMNESLFLFFSIFSSLFVFNLSLTRPSFSVDFLSPLRIGTRGSPLALAQAEETKLLLQKNFPELKDKIIIKKILTQVNYSLFYYLIVFLYPSISLSISLSHSISLYFSLFHSLLLTLSISHFLFISLIDFVRVMQS